MAAAFSPHHRKTTTTSTTTRKNTTFFLVVPLLFCASFSSVSVEANAARFGRKLLQDVSLPSEDVLSGEEAMAMAPAPGPTPMTSTMEEEEEEEEEPTILNEPTKRRRSLLQELGNGPVPSDDGILGEVVDGIEEVFAPAPAPTTMEDDDEEEDLPPVRRKLLQVMGTPAMEEGMMPDMTGMMDPLPGTGMMNMGEAPSPAPAPAPADADIIDDEIIPPGRKLLQEEGDVIMDEVIAVPPTEAPIAEAPAPEPAAIEDIGMIVEETPGRKLLQEELEPQPVINGEEEQEVPPTTEEEEAAAEAPSPIIGTFAITTITGSITAAEDYDPNGTGPN